MRPPSIVCDEEETVLGVGGINSLEMKVEVLHEKQAIHTLDNNKGIMITNY